MEYKKATGHIYIIAIFIGMAAIGLPIYATVLLWSNLNNPGVWLIVGMIWLIAPLVLFVPGIIKGANKKIIIDEEGMILEDVSENKLKWKEIETLKIEYPLANSCLGRPYLAIYTKPDSVYAQDYWDAHSGGVFNKWISSKDSINLSLVIYKQRPEDILNELTKVLNGSRKGTPLTY